MYRIEWLALDEDDDSYDEDNDAITAAWSPEQVADRFGEERLEELIELTPGRDARFEFEGYKLHWDFTTSDKLEKLLGYAKVWEANEDESWSTVRIIDESTGEIIYTSYAGLKNAPVPLDERTDVHVVAVRREDGYLDPDLGYKHGQSGKTVAQIKHDTRNWAHDAWEIQIRDEQGNILARSDEKGRWSEEEAAAADSDDGEGEGPREGESFADYLARLRARDNSIT